MRIFFARTALVLLAGLPLACTAADDAPFKAGQHYKPVRTAQPPADPAKIEVAEVFWYGCVHCFQFEPYVDQWLAKKPAEVAFVRLPSSLGRPVGILHSKAFYAAEVLGVFDKIHKPLFAAMHGDGKTFGTQEELRAFFVKNAGVSAEDFDGAFTGFAADNRVRRTETQLREMGIASTPTVVIDGRWYTNGSMAGGYDKVFAVVEQLVKQARKERKSQ